MKRPYGSGEIYVKSGAWYGRWRTPDGWRQGLLEPELDIVAVLEGVLSFFRDGRRP